MLNGALLIEMLNNYFKKKQEKLWPFDKAKNVVVKKKKKIWAEKNIFLLDFAKYLSYSDVQKNSKFVNY